MESTVRSSSRSPSPSEERKFFDDWTPEPLVPEIDEEQHQQVLAPHIVTSKPGKYIVVDGVKCLNVATHNYLGLADDPRLEDVAITAARAYGVGSCGPRAFYGTMDVHLGFEEKLSKFLNVQACALYSFGFSTIASAIAAYAKATDFIFVDEQCNFAIQQGMVASRSEIVKFAHNDVSDLERKVQDVTQNRMKKRKGVRTFLVVEGIYAKTGKICPLKELVDIAKRHKIRIFIDESRSFGTLGAEGKGVTQHFGVDVNDIDLIMSSLENAFCAYGGFCAGSTYVVEHQRLAGTGYCFSASLPPLQTRAALESLNIISNEPSIIKSAQELYYYAQEKLTNLQNLENLSHPASPIKILVSKTDKLDLDKICNDILEEEQICITVSRHLSDDEMTCPRPSIRLSINGCLMRSEIDRIVLALDRFSTFL